MGLSQFANQTANNGRFCKGIYAHGNRASKWEIICFLDDDIFMEDKLMRVNEIFQSSPDVDYYRHNFREVDYNLKSLKRNSVKHVCETKYIASSDFHW